jgi:hypothetical protein
MRFSDPKSFYKFTLQSRPTMVFISFKTGGMKTLKNLLTVIPILTITLFESCELFPDDPNHFQWIKEGHVLTYDLIYGDTTLNDFAKIEISRSDISDDLEFRETNSSTSFNGGNAGSLFMFRRMVRLSDGLYELVCKNCQMVGPCAAFASLRVPLSPSAGQVLPRHICQDEIYTNDIVVSVDSLISSPVGDFKTIVVKDTLYNSFKFWSESKGLIRVDNYIDGNLASYVLSSTNY